MGSQRVRHDLETEQQQRMAGTLTFMEVKNVCIAGCGTMQRATLGGELEEKTGGW